MIMKPPPLDAFIEKLYDVEHNDTNFFGVITEIPLDADPGGVKKKANELKCKEK